MKAVELRERFGLDSYAVADRPQPEPGPGEVLLKMSAWSLNYRDLLVALGYYNPKLQFPLVPLSDGVGEIVAFGPPTAASEALGLKVGDRVAGCFMPTWLSGDVTDADAAASLGGGAPGVLAEYVVLPATGVVKYPAHLTDVEASTLPCAAVTAWHALFEGGRVQPGDVVLTQGTGGVSLFAIQFARAAGCEVISTSSSDDKLARLTDLGAKHLINYKKQPDWAQAALAITQGRGVDRVIEVGGAGTLPASIQAVRRSGVVSLIGVLTGLGEFNPMLVLMKSIRLQGIFVGSRAMFESMNKMIAQHELRPVVDRVFGFDELRPALEYMQSGKHFGKVCLKL